MRKACRWIPCIQMNVNGRQRSGRNVSGHLVPECMPADTKDTEDMSLGAKYPEYMSGGAKDPIVCLWAARAARAPFTGRVAPRRQIFLPDVEAPMNI